MASVFMVVAGGAVKHGGTAKAVYDTYQAHGSPQASLENSGRKLEKIRLRLQGLSPQRREEIEVATQLGTFGNENSRTLADIEKELQDLSDTLCRLNKRYERASWRERYLPFTQFRSLVATLEVKVKTLLNDTWNTTVPYVDDIEFDPSEHSWQAMPLPAISSQPDAVPTGV